MNRVLAIVPARGGSKGLPRKNVRTLAGLPLVAHAIRFAERCPGVTNVVVSTEDDEIAATARRHGAEVPFARPRELARDETPMWPVVRHALGEMETLTGAEYDGVLLVQPTTPLRRPADAARAATTLDRDDSADGVVSVVRVDPEAVHGLVTAREGYLDELIPGARTWGARQDIPPVFRVTGSFYLWRRDFVRREPSTWTSGRIRPLEVDATGAVDIDTAADFAEAEARVNGGRFPLDWLDLVKTPEG